MIICHVIVDLEKGGAEKALYNLVINDCKNCHVVIVLMQLGFYGNLLNERGIKCFALDLNRGAINFSSIFKLYKLIKNISPDVVQTWMYHADFLGGIIAKIVGVKKIFWYIHHSNLSLTNNKFSTFLLMRILSLVSWFVPNRIISVSNKSIDVHRKIGYKNIFNFIPLSFDENLFFYSDSIRACSRKKFNFDDDLYVVGHIGRWDAQKDYNNFFKAIHLVQTEIPTKKILFVFVGIGLNYQNTEVLELLDKYSIDHNKVFLLGTQDNINELYNSFDLFVLSSVGEAFPNVIGEAMLCNLPIVATNCGDVKIILNGFGSVVPVRDSFELMKAIVFSLSSTIPFDRLICNQSRNSIINNYSINRMLNSFYSIWAN